jgi:predicted TIM-barrel fold metal-dependent hydrolase
MAVFGAGASRAVAAGVEQAVPNSTGSAPPDFDVPPNACDCHHHIYDGRFPVSPHWKQGFPPGATVSDYRLLQKRLGTSRSVVVQPSTYGIDNRCLVDALGQLGEASRGVAVVDTDVQDAELRALTSAGVRAIRINFVSPQTWGTTTPEILATLAGG